MVPVPTSGKPNRFARLDQAFTAGSRLFGLPASEVVPLGDSLLDSTEGLYGSAALAPRPCTTAAGPQGRGFHRALGRLRLLLAQD